jgi:hypothetical protein
MVTKQNSAPVQKQLRKHGLRLERELILKSNPRPYVKAGIFLDSIKTLFLPYFIRIRGLAGFAAEDAILLMENWSAHATDDVIRLLAETRVPVISVTSHPTHIFQVLDLTLFDVLKRSPG